MHFIPRQHHILQAMRNGATLKLHRTLDGEKVHRLHPLDGEPETVERHVVESLIALDLIQSNLKFPAATYVLTDKGVNTLNRLAQG